LDTTPTVAAPVVFDTTLYTSTGHCDSIVRLRLTVLPVYDIMIKDTICLGERYTNSSYLFLDTMPTVAAPVVFDTTLYTSTGHCDSIVRLRLTVLPVYDIMIKDTVCLGERYTNPVYTFLDTTPTVAAPVVFDTTLYTATGHCDSIVRLRLTVLPVYDIMIKDTVCLGERYTNPVYTFLDTTPTVAAPVVFDTTLYTSTGHCDSIVRLRLTVLLPYDTLITDAVCLGESYTKYGFNIETTQAGIAHYSQNLKRANGCDSIINLNLTINPVYDITINAAICSGDNYYANGFDISVLTPGFYTYTHSFKTVNNCDSTVTLNLTVNPVYSEYISAKIYEDEFYKIGNYQYNKPGLHVSNLRTVEDCDSIVTLILDVIYYPAETAFSPFNKDGVNDYFMPGFKVQIFNRYGALIYETSSPEAQALGWDGRNKQGKNVEPGVYFYILYNSSGKPRLKSSVEILKR
jgi:hypothetical protein